MPRPGSEPGVQHAPLHLRLRPSVSSTFMQTVMGLFHARHSTTGKTCVVWDAVSWWRTEGLQPIPMVLLTQILLRICPDPGWSWDTTSTIPPLCDACAHTDSYGTTPFQGWDHMAGIRSIRCCMEVSDMAISPPPCFRDCPVGLAQILGCPT